MSLSLREFHPRCDELSLREFHPRCDEVPRKARNLMRCFAPFLNSQFSIFNSQLLFRFADGFLQIEASPYKPPCLRLRHQCRAFQAGDILEGGHAAGRDDLAGDRGAQRRQLVKVRTCEHAVLVNVGEDDMAHADGLHALRERDVVLAAVTQPIVRADGLALGVDADNDLVAVLFTASATNSGSRTAAEPMITRAETPSASTVSTSCMERMPPPSSTVAPVSRMTCSTTP